MSKRFEQIRPVALSVSLKPELPKFAWPGLARQLRLTEREAAVVEGLFAGDSEFAIARRLGISFHTVHTYVGRVYRKLSVTTRGELFLRVFAAYVANSGQRAGVPWSMAPRAAGGSQVGSIGSATI